MTVVTEIENIQRVTERLYGILTGISIDKKLLDGKIIALNGWLKDHETLHNLEPFRSTVLLIERCLVDKIIDESEREEIIEWCGQFDDRFLLPNDMTSAIRRLNGVLKGIGIDGTTREDEVWGLNDWLENYRVFSNHLPFSGTRKLLEQILEDGKVTDDEKRDLFDFCRRFTKRTADAQPDAGVGGTDTSVLASFDRLCDRTVGIEFENKRFCFTGLSKTGPRKVLQDMVLPLGAIPVPDVIPNLDYLVIGAQGTPCWACSSYVLKIEKALDYRRKGRIITILHEDDFIAQIEQAKGDNGVK